MYIIAFGYKKKIIRPEGPAKKIILLQNCPKKISWPGKKIPSPPPPRLSNGPCLSVFIPAFSFSPSKIALSLSRRRFKLSVVHFHCFHLIRAIITNFARSHVCMVFIAVMFHQYFPTDVTDKRLICFPFVYGLCDFISFKEVLFTKLSNISSTLVWPSKRDHCDHWLPLSYFTSKI